MTMRGVVDVSRVGYKNAKCVLA